MELEVDRIFIFKRNTIFLKSKSEERKSKEKYIAFQGQSNLIKIPAFRAALNIGHWLNCSNSLPMRTTKMKMKGNKKLWK